MEKHAVSSISRQLIHVKYFFKGFGDDIVDAVWGEIKSLVITDSKFRVYFSNIRPKISLGGFGGGLGVGGLGGLLSAITGAFTGAVSAFAGAFSAVLGAVGVAVDLSSVIFAGRAAGIIKDTSDGIEIARNFIDLVENIHEKSQENEELEQDKESEDSKEDEEDDEDEDDECDVNENNKRRNRRSPLMNIENTQNRSPRENNTCAYIKCNQFFASEKWPLFEYYKRQGKKVVRLCNNIGHNRKVYYATLYSLDDLIPIYSGNCLQLKLILYFFKLASSRRSNLEKRIK